MIERFEFLGTSYAFNKAHDASYARLAYLSACGPNSSAIRVRSKRVAALGHRGQTVFSSSPWVPPLSDLGLSPFPLLCINFR
jgi:hypothetical protein